MRFWHNLNFQEVAKLLETDIEKGLTLKEVEARQERFGKNIVPEEKTFSSLRIFLEQFESPLIYVLVIAGLVTLALREWTDSIVIFGAIFINALFGFWRENRASKILAKLRQVLKTKAVVLREEQKIEVLQEDLVPGDIIFLKAGDRVPADGRLMEAENLKISEAILTGEWLPADKRTEILPKETPLADRDNMVYMGTTVESGEGRVVVTETGLRTETGKIAALVKETKEEKTPLQKNLAKFGKTVGILIGVICVFIFVGGVFRGHNFLQMFEASIAIAVGGIPEALSVVMAVILAIGMERILRKKGLVRRLSSVETLGSAQVVCFDKTRTLTQGKMVLEEVVAEDENLALKIAVLGSEGFVENPKDSPENWKIMGSPTDIVLIKTGIEKGLLKPNLEREFPQIAKLPFDSVNKYLLSLRKEGKDVFLYISGAPERVLERSKKKGNWPKVLNELTKKGLRVIGVGYKKIPTSKFPASEDLNKLAKDFNFVGLLALKDPLRPDVKEAIKICQQAGMKPILVTGDHKLTAKAVAQEIGLQITGEDILEGKELEKLSEDELEKILEKIQVYARVEPKHKMRIISAWQKKGKVVAMTGDGVNDAPALKKADIGVALGSGTEVAKESSDLILLNDSFSILIKTIKEGRVILDNLRKAITYVMTDAFAEVITVGGATLLNWPLPILAVQILWNNLVQDSIPNLAFAFESAEAGVMERKPSLPQASLLTKEMKIIIFRTGIIYQFLALVLFVILWKILNLDLSYARTMVFGFFVVKTAFVIFSYKSLRKNIWQYNPFSNKVLNLATLIILAFFTLSIYFPPLQVLLKTQPIGLGSWLILITFSLISVVLIEITKWYFIRRQETEI